VPEFVANMRCRGLDFMYGRLGSNTLQSQIGTVRTGTATKQAKQAPISLLLVGCGPLYLRGLMIIHSEYTSNLHFIYREYVYARYQAPRIAISLPCMSFPYPCHRQANPQLQGSEGLPSMPLHPFDDQTNG
jgi:hypothetical protein